MGQEEREVNQSGLFPSDAVHIKSRAAAIKKGRSILAMLSVILESGAGSCFISEFPEFYIFDQVTRFATQLRFL